jgi:hypothetical protein
MLNGKGLFMWMIRDSSGGDPARIAANAHAWGLSWVAIKIADGASPFNLRPNPIPPRYADDITAPVVEALKSKGIRVWGWQYNYGSNPAGEAEMAVKRCKQFALDGLIIDPEAEFKAHKDRRVNARALMAGLRAGLGNAYPIGLCSYRYPSLHLELPWVEFLSRCDFHSPQVYWVQSTNPAQQLARSVNELRTLEKTNGLRPLPIIPIGAAYKEHGWRPTPEQLDRFNSEAKMLSLPGIGWWVWSHAESLGFAPVIAGHDWPRPDQAEKPPEPPDKEKIARLWKYANSQGWAV